MTRLRFRDWDCTVQKRQYDNGRPALQLVDAEDGSPIAKATVNLPDVPLGKNQVLIKSYAENEGLLEALTEAGVVKPTGQTVRSGFVEIPVCELQPPFRDVSHAERAEQTRGKPRSR
ncbi:DUF4313 domain-containing protein [Tundrisphaera lichenicola]|uniref:DUF4313 domain-containing protein n=1 Tax=Tundrisphaera lichenicola TaxID=2029860 RepID=UPI003EB7684A